MVPCAGVLSALHQRAGNVTCHVLSSRVWGYAATPPLLSHDKTVGRWERNWVVGWLGGYTQAGHPRSFHPFPAPPCTCSALSVEAALHHTRFAPPPSGLGLDKDDAVRPWQEPNQASWDGTDAPEGSPSETTSPRGARIFRRSEQVLLVALRKRPPCLGAAFQKGLGSKGGRHSAAGLAGVVRGDLV